MTSWLLTFHEKKVKSETNRKSNVRQITKQKAADCSVSRGFLSASHSAPLQHTSVKRMKDPKFCSDEFNALIPRGALPCVSAVKTCDVPYEQILSQLSPTQMLLSKQNSSVFPWNYFENCWFTNIFSTNLPVTIKLYPKRTPIHEKTVSQWDKLGEM